MMRVIIDPESGQNVITTIAIGQSHFDTWAEYALPTWQRYCERHQLGLIAFDADLISKDHPKWKKPTWQKMLIGQTLRKELPTVRNVCNLDTDILVNYMAPNVFEHYDPEKIGLVSVRKNMAYPLDPVLRRLAFLRNKYYDERYPLDSSLHISIERLYQVHGFPPQKDETCCGFMVFNVDNHADLMSNWFGKYNREVTSITGGGEQTHFNFEVQNWGKVQWMDYRFQAQWTYEMPWKYPFLYRGGADQKELVKECIEASLFVNYFLHFAGGSWHEGDMWKAVHVLETPEVRKIFEDFSEYEQIPLTGEPLGTIKRIDTDNQPQGVNDGRKQELSLWPKNSDSSS